VIHDECIMEPSNRELERLRLRVLELEAREARVRAFRNTLNGSGCAWEESIKPFRDALDLALDGEVKP